MSPDFTKRGANLTKILDSMVGFMRMLGGSFTQTASHTTDRHFGFAEKLYTGIIGVEQMQ